MKRVGLVVAVWMLATLPVFGRVWQPQSGRAPSSESSAVEDEETRRIFRQSVALGIPEAELSELVRHCREANFTAAELRRVLSLMARAKLAGLPHDDLLNKLREGLAKGVTPEAIERAVESKAQTLRRAKSLVDTLLTEGRIAPNYVYALKVVADALEAGVPPTDVLRSVREGRPPPEGTPDVRRVLRDLR
jgi:hypothetical protein